MQMTIVIKDSDDDNEEGGKVADNDELPGMTLIKKNSAYAYCCAGIVAMKYLRWHCSIGIVLVEVLPF